MKPSSTRIRTTTISWRAIVQKIKSGETHVVTPEGEERAEAPQSAEVIDLAALLFRRSLERKGRGKSEEPVELRRAAAGKLKHQDGGRRTSRRGSPSQACVRRPQARIDGRDFTSPLL